MAACLSCFVHVIHRELQEGWLEDDGGVRVRRVPVEGLQAGGERFENPEALLAAVQLLHLTKTNIFHFLMPPPPCCSSRFCSLSQPLLLGVHTCGLAGGVRRGWEEAGRAWGERESSGGSGSWCQLQQLQPGRVALPTGVRQCVHAALVQL